MPQTPTKKGNTQGVTFVSKRTGRNGAKQLTGSLLGRYSVATHSSSDSHEPDIPIKYGKPLTRDQSTWRQRLSKGGQDLSVWTHTLSLCLYSYRWLVSPYRSLPNARVFHL